jgi:hypothetical protein
MKRTLTILLLIAGCLEMMAQATGVKAYVEPLLTTRWGQDAPYNLQCPEKTNAKDEQQHCRVGCVACAMGQVMRYHRYPEVGIGTGQNIFNQKLTANFGETHYDWANMRDSYRTGYTEDEAAAVAELLYHCGVAVNMIYGLESSSTFTAFANNMTTALSRYFGYDAATLRSVNRSKYTKEEWLQIIREELSAGRPIIYSGNSPSMGGHTWVVDGYDEAGRVHMNWGWLGSLNDYYDIDLNVPGLDFSEKQSMVIGIQPGDDATHLKNDDAMHLMNKEESIKQKLYTVDGRAVELPTDRGLYIRNGKKMLRK